MGEVRARKAMSIIILFKMGRVRTKKVFRRGHQCEEKKNWKKKNI